MIGIQVAKIQRWNKKPRAIVIAMAVNVTAAIASSNLSVFILLSLSI